MWDDQFVCVFWVNEKAFLLDDGEEERSGDGGLSGPGLGVSNAFCMVEVSSISNMLTISSSMVS